MEDHRILKRKLRAVMWAGIVGAILPALFTGGVQLGYELWGQGYHGKPSTDFWMGLGFIVAVPTVFVKVKTGLLISPYLLNALLGSALFSIPMAVWQFVLKGDH